MKRRNKRSGSTMIMVSVIIAINLAGINYAQWNGGMRVTSSVSTGIFDAQIVDFNITGDSDSEGLIGLRGLKGAKRLRGSKDGSDLKIVGTMQEGETATVTYSVKNSGTLPVKFGEPKVVEKSGLKFDMELAVKDVDGKTGGTGQFEITAWEVGDYSFTVELPYSLDVQ